MFILSDGYLRIKTVCMYVMIGMEHHQKCHNVPFYSKEISIETNKRGLISACLDSFKKQPINCMEILQDSCNFQLISL